MLRWTTTIFFLIAVMMGVNFSGCSGCSKTGREELAREQRQEAQQEQIDRQQGKAGNKIVDQPENSQRAIDIPEPSGSDSSVSVLSVLYRRCKKSVFLIYTSNEKGTFQGSGFFISPDGVAISNYHVFEDTYQGQERIHLGEDRVYRISRVLRKSQEHDYIIFQVDVPGQVPYLEIAQSLPAVGEEVFTIGNPRGLDQTLSQGIVSGYRRHRKLIQTTTEITHGSSGGPLMNMSGEVIGITTMGIGQANLNFAVNIHLLDIHR